MMRTRFVDMKKTPVEATGDFTLPTPSDGPNYPYGLCISLCGDELEKLDLEDANLEPGDILHLHAFAVVTSVSSRAPVGEESDCRVELQITHLACEDEDKENEESESTLSKLYG